ncbi:MAG: hypothetical protein GXW85_06865 [Clostridia bacterium]|nr:hypothetical protein [Clostridia bacterium]
MPLKLKQAIILTVSLFLSGNLITFIGFLKGRDIATSLSRPAGASIWSTSNEMILACTYVPIIIGLSLIVLSLIFSTVLFVKWLKEN